MTLTSFGGPEHIVKTDLAVPKPADGEALIRVSTVGVNHQDIFTMTGRAQRIPVSLPHVMGIDPSGVIVEVGPEFEGLTIGQRVVVKPPISCGSCSYCTANMDDSCTRLRNVGVHRFGGHAEYVAVPARSVFPIADNLSHVEATALAHSFPVALQMLDRIELGDNEVVLVSGASGAVGSAAIQLAKLRGAFVIGAASSRQRAEAAKAAGADMIIDYGTTAGFAESLLEGAPGRVTAYIDPVSNPAVWSEAMKTLGTRARVAVCGSHGGPIVELDNNWLFRTRVAIFGSSGSTIQGMGTILDLASQRRIMPSIDSVRPLDEIREAFSVLAAGKNKGKIVLEVV